MKAHSLALSLSFHTLACLVHTFLASTCWWSVHPSREGSGWPYVTRTKRKVGSFGNNLQSHFQIFQKADVSGLRCRHRYKWWTVNWLLWGARKEALSAFYEVGKAWELSSKPIRRSRYHWLIFLCWWGPDVRPVVAGPRLVHWNIEYELGHQTSNGRPHRFATVSSQEQHFCPPYHRTNARKKDN